ncbi:MAG: ABC transporter permease [Ferruginibacter sp.]
MTFKDSLSLSWKNVRGNKLRTVITIIIMALGILALIMITTAIKVASNSLSSSFSTMGANSFSIRFRERTIRFGHGGGDNSSLEKKSSLRQRKSNSGIPISFAEAGQFKERYAFPGAIVSLALRGAGGIVVNTGSKKTNPDVNVFGSDENYLEMNGYLVKNGRNFTPAEITSGASVCILGSGVAEKLFPDNPAKALEAVVNVDHRPYRVIAVLEDKGSSAFFNTSRVVIIPYNNVRRFYATQNTSYTVAVMVKDMRLMDVAIGEAKATFRPIRKLAVTDDENFYIDRSDSVAEAFFKNMGWLEKGTVGIGFITLIGAAIGLMNIMLVAVNERTKEIGLSKALGGTKKDIRNQFLFESILISLMGALLGIVSGILVGNIVAILFKSAFVVPWGWVVIAVIVCSLTGLVAGLYPAYKASKLDPIVALRYE